MRPTSRPQSALRCPLNHLLGTEANVRVLRVITLSDIPIGVAELARRTQLQASGIARVCTRLEDLGVIEAVGRGERNRQYRRTQRYSLATPVMTLFLEERTRAEQAISELRTAVEQSGVRAGWIEGPVARGTDHPGDPLIVGVLVDPGEVESVRTGLGQQLLLIQAQRDVVIDLRVLTLADLRTADQKHLAELETAQPLSGPLPLDIADLRPGAPSEQRGAPRKRHQDIDLRSKEFARIIADRLRRDPSLVEDAKRYIERRVPGASPGERLELAEWQTVLSTMSLPRLRRFLLEDSARATRLRQSSPFIAALPDEERKEILDRSARRR